MSFTSFLKYRVGLIGNYGSNLGLVNGQTIKTTIVSSEIEKKIGEKNAIRLSTDGGISFLIKMPFVLFFAVLFCKNIVIFPAQNGLRIIVPLLFLLNVIIHRELHYVVIGGWLPDFLKKRFLLTFCLKKFNGIYVETEKMKSKLETQGFQNVFVMPNFKNLQILKKDGLICNKTDPFKFCTFSRVMKEKGIEDAVDAIQIVNESYGRKCELDIYGAIESNQTVWFGNLQKRFPSYVKYGGCIPFDKSVNVLKEYYGLLFPTYYEGEGFAGTLFDSFAAGVPVIASDWHYNAELLENGKVGFLCDIHNVQDLANKICKAIDFCDDWILFKNNCIDKAECFVPSKVINILLSRIGG